MGYRELSRMEIVEVVRRWQLGESQRAIARGSGVARETVKKYLGAAEELGLAARPEGIVPGDLNQAGEKPVARLARGAGELAQAVYQISQELQGMRVLFQATGRDRRGGAPSTEHCGTDEEIRT